MARHIGPDIQDSAIIIVSGTIVRAGEYSDEPSVGLELVAVLHDLVRATDQVQVVFLYKLGNHVLAKIVGGPSFVVLSPPALLAWVRPQKIVGYTIFADHQRPQELVYLLQALQIRAEASMHAKNAVANYSCYGQVLENARKSFPSFNRDSSFAYVTEVIHSSQNPQTILSYGVSWLPLRRNIRSWQRILQAMSRQIHSRDCFPLSTQSPRNKQLLPSLGAPRVRRISFKSEYWPCTSPQTMIGGFNSSSIGCECTTSLNLQHIVKIYSSVRTNWFGLIVLDLRSLSITESTSICRHCLMCKFSIRYGNKCIEAPQKSSGKSLDQNESKVKTLVLYYQLAAFTFAGQSLIGSYFSFCFFASLVN